MPPGDDRPQWTQEEIDHIIAEQEYNDYLAEQAYDEWLTQRQEIDDFGFDYPGLDF